MFAYSTFRHDWTKSNFPCKIPRSKDYRVYVNGEEVPVYTCRISSYPFNTWWPGHQRHVNQTEIVSYVNLVADEELRVEVEPLTDAACSRVMVKPYSKGVQAKKVGDRFAFSLRENGGYLFEQDDYHGCLYLFCNRPVSCEDPQSVTYYFGKGVHFAGKITLKSNESVYVDRDALVYGNIFAEDAENIRIFGNGIFEDSTEERISEDCYEPYANGNVKFYDCKNIRIQGVGFVNSAVWCVNLFHCFDVEFDGVNVFGQWRYNTDGIDIVNSRRVTVRNSFVHSFDDTITVKGIDRYAYESNKDILVENCVLLCDWGRTCEIGLETNCEEYSNITFRNCDVVRGGNTVCDIQNGDCAEVHHITFENIRVELESFYTPEVYQATQEMTYDKKHELYASAIVCISNPRFRDTYAFLGMDGASPYTLSSEDPRFASVHDVSVKDITIYCDEKLLAARICRDIVVIDAINTVETAEFRDITVENIVINGKRIAKADMTVRTRGKVENLQIL